MNVNLDELMRLRESATPGPWKVATWYGGYHTIRPKKEPEKSLGQIERKADAAYIVAACNAVPELLDDLESLREKGLRRISSGNRKGRAQGNELRQRDLEAKISQLALDLEKERAISKQLVEFMDQDLDACVEHIWNGILRRGRECKDCASCWRTAAEKAIHTHKEKSHDRP